MREIYVSRAGDPFHAGDKALTRETPAQRGWVNRYAECNVCCSVVLFVFGVVEFPKEVVSGMVFNTTFNNISDIP